MKIKELMGAGDRIIGFTLPFALAGIILNVIYPQFFRINMGLTGTILGSVLLAIGVPLWLISAVQVLINVPRNRLITTGPFAIVLHPLYVSVALMVIPGIGFVFDTWAGLAIGIILYLFSRRFSVEEEKKLNEIFTEEYRAYRSRVLLPWL